MLDLRREPYKIEHLYHMTSVDNLRSIIEYGLLSHNRAHREGYVISDISLQEVNDRRGYKSVYGRPLHGYVPLYFNPRNPMLAYRRALQDNIAILYLDKSLLFQDDTVFADGNAANNATAFYRDLQDLDRLDWHCINYPGNNWHIIENGRQVTRVENRRKRCAEVLIPDIIPAHFIEQVAVRTRATLLALDEIVKQQTEVVVRPELYF